MHFLIRWLVTAIALALAIRIIPGLSFPADDWGGLAILALVLGLVNVIIRPVIKLISLPLTILTLGLFTLVINAAMLWLAAWVSNQVNPDAPFVIDGWIAAVIGALFISIVSAVLASFLGGE